MGKTVQKYGRRRRRRTPTKKDSSISNGRKQEPEPEPEVLITSSDSQPKVSNSDPPESEPEDEEEPKTSDISNQTTDKEDDNVEEEEKEEDEDGVGDGEEEEEDVKTSAKNQKKMKMAEEKESPLYTFAMNRIQRIVRSEAAGDVRLTEEAVFLINKASEKFLELVCQETYACCVKDHKNYVAYKHVSSVVSKKRRYDFLSDFVPEKMKAEDALEERKSAGL